MENNNMYNLERNLITNHTRILVLILICIALVTVFSIFYHELQIAKQREYEAQRIIKDVNENDIIKDMEEIYGKHYKH